MQFTPSPLQPGNGPMLRNKPAAGARLKRAPAVVARCALYVAVFVAASVAGIASAAAQCTQPDTPIETDRPDVTNSAIVVPVGSLQNENGVDTSRDHGADILSG